MIKRACSKEQIELRKKEIISTVKEMFETIDYQDISMKTISEKISIARSSLYCYYNNKEEIMLDLLKNDYINWLNKTINIFYNDKSTIDELTNNLTKNYLSNINLLKIISIYLSDIETHVSIEKLIDFKSSFVDLLPKLKTAIKFYFKNITIENVDNLYNSIFMLTHSLYPKINPNNNQKKAMELIGMEVCSNPYQFTYNYISFILKSCL